MIGGTPLRILAIPCFSDNFAYFISSGSSKSGIIIDPGESNPIRNFISKTGSITKDIFCTHKHMDHIGGVRELKEEGDMNIYAGSKEGFTETTQTVEDKEEHEVENIYIKGFHVPCHTKGHMIYLVSSDPSASIPNPQEHTEVEDNGYMEYGGIHRALFTGDCLFIGGCGRFFEGTPKQMQHNCDLIRTLPLDTAIFCGHEYTIQNLSFGQRVETYNLDIKSRLAEARQALDLGRWTIPSSIEGEIKYNIFMRTRTQDIQNKVGNDDPVQCMKTIRSWKDNDYVPI